VGTTRQLVSDKEPLGKESTDTGAYSKVPVSCGFTGHDVAPPQGWFFTDKQLQAFKQDERAEMSHLVQGMNNYLTDQDEMDELACDLWVKFVEPLKEQPSTKKASKARNSMDDLCNALAVDSLGTKKKKVTAPELWSHIKKGNRSVMLNPAEANAATAKGCRIDQIFPTQEEAEAWLEGNEDSDEEDNDPPNLVRHTQSLYNSDGYSVLESESNKGGRRQVERCRAKKRAHKARKHQSTREANMSSSQRVKK
jgi:hypothetical protein